MHGQTDFGIERLHQALGAIRGEQAGHVFDGDGIGPEVFELLAVLQITVERVHRRYRVGNGALEPTAACLNSLGVIDDIANIVQRIEHAKDLNAVFFRACDKTVHDVFGIVLISHEVLTAREHGQIGIGHVGFDGSQTLPRVLIEKTQTCVKRRATPRFNGPIPNLVHFRQDGQHIAELHAGSPQALLAVADGGVHQLQTRHASPLTFQIEPRCHGSMKADAWRHISRGARRPLANNVRSGKTRTASVRLYPPLRPRRRRIGCAVKLWRSSTISRDSAFCRANNARVTHWKRKKHKDATNKVASFSKAPMHALTRMGRKDRPPNAKEPVPYTKKARLNGPFDYIRLMKRPSRVSICSTSPTSTNMGTFTSAPVSSVAGLVEP